MRTARVLLSVAAAALLVGTGALAGAATRGARLDASAMDAPIDWSDPGLLAALQAAVAEGVGYDAAHGATVPLALTSGVFIRPGAAILVLSGVANVCTSGFVFGTPGSYEISTAGHCGERGSPVMVLAAPSLALPIGSIRVASCAPSEDRAPCWGDDYAIIRIDPFWQPFVDPSITDAGGPSSPDGSSSGVVRYVGLGVTRIGAAPAPNVPPSASYFTCACPSAPGDSGAPVVDALTGAAVGILTLFSAAPFTIPYGVGTPVSILQAAAGQPLARGGVDPVPRPLRSVEAETGILPLQDCAIDGERAGVYPGGSNSVVFLPARGCSLGLYLGDLLAPLQALRISVTGFAVVCGTLLIAGSTMGEASPAWFTFCLPAGAWVDVPTRGVASGGGIVTVTWVPIVEWDNVFIDYAVTGEPLFP